MIIFVMLPSHDKDILKKNMLKNYFKINNNQSGKTQLKKIESNFFSLYNTVKKNCVVFRS